MSWFSANLFYATKHIMVQVAFENGHAVKIILDVRKATDTKTLCPSQSRKPTSSFSLEGSNLLNFNITGYKAEESSTTIYKTSQHAPPSTRHYVENSFNSHKPTAAFTVIQVLLVKTYKATCSRRSKRYI